MFGDGDFLASLNFLLGKDNMQGVVYAYSKQVRVPIIIISCVCHITHSSVCRDLFDVTDFRLHALLFCTTCFILLHAMTYLSSM